MLRQAANGAEAIEIAYGVDIWFKGKGKHKGIRVRVVELFDRAIELLEDGKA